MVNKIPLEIIIKIALKSTKYFARGEIISFSPGANDLDFRDFLTGHNERNLDLFASGAKLVFYDNSIRYLKSEDKCYFEGEFNTPIRELVYEKEHK